MPKAKIPVTSSIVINMPTRDLLLVKQIILLLSVLNIL